MSKATGQDYRIGLYQDADSILIGDVRAGEKRPAENRTGSARLLENPLNTARFVVFTAVGGQAASAGGYFVEVAHVAQNGSMPAANSTNWIQVGAITIKGTKPQEIGLTGPQLESLIRDKTSPAIPSDVDVRVAGIRFVAGTGTGAGGNGLAAPVGTGNRVSFSRA